MGDIACVYEMNLIQENKQMEQDLLSGRGLDVLLCLLDHLTTQEQIAVRLGMPIFSVKLYLERLVQAGLVKCKTLPVRDGKLRKEYALVADEISIINRLKENTTLADKRRNEIAAHHYAALIRSAIKGVGDNAQKANRIKAYFMNAKDEDMREFNKELTELFEKFQSLEEKDESNMYSLFTVLAPYKAED